MQCDPIADMLSRIRNALVAHHDRTRVPASRMKVRLAEILKEEGYVSDVREDDNDKGHKNIEIVLKYGQGRKPAIDGLKRVSRPGRRVYVGKDKIPFVYSGMGIAILSTSSGIMTDEKARRLGVGGELLCEVW